MLAQVILNRMRGGVGDNNAELFRSEALELADMFIDRGRTPEVAINATPDDLTRLIQDPIIASIYTIGHGSLSTFSLQKHGDYDWRITSEVSTHLKRGFFVQRHCGWLSRRLNVPLGFFVLSDNRNLIAPFNEDFSPKSTTDRENKKLKPIFRGTRISYEAMLRLKDRKNSGFLQWMIQARV